MRAITRKEGEAFPHRDLWQCAKVQYEHAQKVEKGRKSFDMAAVLMAYLTYEAYLNFVGARLDPKAWRNEKQFFSKNEYYGIEGKLKRIVELCGDFRVDKSRRPYQTIRELGKFRSSIVHAKVYKYDEPIEHHVDHEPNCWPRSAFSYVNIDTTRRVMADVEEFIEYLHSKIRPFVNDIWFGDKALKGPTGYALSSTSIKT